MNNLQILWLIEGAKRATGLMNYVLFAYKKPAFCMK